MALTFDSGRTSRGLSRCARCVIDGCCQVAMGKKRTVKKAAKKTRKPLDAVIAANRAAARARTDADATVLEEDTGVAPQCVARLASTDPVEREGALNDVTRFVLDVAQSQVLFRHGVVEAAAKLLADDLPAIQLAAAAAMRNMLLVGRDAVADSVYPNPKFDTVGTLVNAALARVQAIEAAEQSQSPADDAGDEDAADTPAETAALGYATLDELLQLATVLAEGNEAAADALSASHDFLALLVRALSCASEPIVQQSAAECLRVLSEDSAAVAGFFRTLPAHQIEVLNSAVSSVPVSPALLRVSVNLAGVLLNTAPSPESGMRAMAVLVAALDTSPLKSAQALTKLLSADCALDGAVRQHGVAQTFDRLRAMQAALAVLGDVMDIVCAEQSDDVDDEAAFGVNPARGVLTDTGLLPLLVQRAAEAMAPLTDPVLVAALRTPNDNGDITTLQALVASIDVGVLGIASGVMMLLPLQAFGNLGNMWRLAFAALQSTYDMLDQGHGCPVPSSCLALQLESLSTILFTIQRKDKANECGAAAQHTDLFSRIVWMTDATTATKTSVLSTLGLIGMKLRDAGAAYAVSNVCLRLIARADENENASMEVAAEAANALMDVLAEDDFDDNVYVPLNVDEQLRAFVPRLKAFMHGMKGANRAGSPAWVKRRHLDDIATNAHRFVQYKRERCKNVGAAARTKAGRR